MFDMEIRNKFYTLLTVPGYNFIFNQSILIQYLNPGISIVRKQIRTNTSQMKKVYYRNGLVILNNRYRIKNIEKSKKNIFW